MCKDVRSHPEWLKKAFKHLFTVVDIMYQRLEKDTNLLLHELNKKAFLKTNLNAG